MQTVQGAALVCLSSSQRGEPPWKPELGRSLQEEHSSSTPPWKNAEADVACQML